MMTKYISMVSSAAVLAIVRADAGRIGENSAYTVHPCSDDNECTSHTGTPYCRRANMPSYNQDACVQCRNNLDCIGADICDHAAGSICKDPECDAQNPCDGDKPFCSNGVCSECRTDSGGQHDDCGDEGHLFCNSLGRCVSQFHPRHECNDNGNEQCVVGICRKDSAGVSGDCVPQCDIDNPCNGGLVCKSTVQLCMPTNWCSLDEHCSSGEHCNMFSNECVADQVCLDYEFHCDLGQGGGGNCPAGCEWTSAGSGSCKSSTPSWLHLGASCHAINHNPLLDEFEKQLACGASHLLGLCHWHSGNSYCHLPTDPCPCSRAGGDWTCDGESIDGNLFVNKLRMCDGSDSGFTKPNLFNLSNGVVAITNLSGGDIQDCSFSGMRIKRLDLSGNTLTDLHEGAFFHASIKALDLSANSLTCDEFPFDAIGDMSLDFLDLTGNSLVDLFTGSTVAENSNEVEALLDALISYCNPCDVSTAVADGVTYDDVGVYLDEGTGKCMCDRLNRNENPYVPLCSDSHDVCQSIASQTSNLWRWDATDSIECITERECLAHDGAPDSPGPGCLRRVGNPGAPANLCRSMTNWMQQLCRTPDDVCGWIQADRESNFCRPESDPHVPADFECVDLEEDTSQCKTADGICQADSSNERDPDSFECAGAAEPCTDENDCADETMLCVRESGATEGTCQFVQCTHSGECVEFDDDANSFVACHDPSDEHANTDQPDPHCRRVQSDDCPCLEHTIDTSFSCYFHEDWTVSEFVGMLSMCEEPTVTRIASEEWTHLKFAGLPNDAFEVDIFGSFGDLEHLEIQGNCRQEESNCIDSIPPMTFFNRLLNLRHIKMNDLGLSDISFVQWIAGIRHLEFKDNHILCIPHAVWTHLKNNPGAEFHYLHMEGSPICNFFDNSATCSASHRNAVDVLLDEIADKQLGCLPCPPFHCADSDAQECLPTTATQCANFVDGSCQEPAVGAGCVSQIDGTCRATDAECATCENFIGPDCDEQAHCFSHPSGCRAHCAVVADQEECENGRNDCQWDSSNGSCSDSAAVVCQNLSEDQCALSENADFCGWSHFYGECRAHCHMVNPNDCESRDDCDLTEKNVCQVWHDECKYQASDECDVNECELHLGTCRTKCSAFSPADGDNSNDCARYPDFCEPAAGGQHCEMRDPRINCRDSQYESPASCPATYCKWMADDAVCVNTCIFLEKEDCLTVDDCQWDDIDDGLCNAKCDVYDADDCPDDDITQCAVKDAPQNDGSGDGLVLRGESLVEKVCLPEWALPGGQPSEPRKPSCESLNLWGNVGGILDLVSRYRCSQREDCFWSWSGKHERLTCQDKCQSKGSSMDNCERHGEVADCAFRGSECSVSVCKEISSPLQCRSRGAHQPWPGEKCLWQEGAYGGDCRTDCPSLTYNDVWKEQCDKFEGCEFSSPGFNFDCRFKCSIFDNNVQQCAQQSHCTHISSWTPLGAEKWHCRTTCQVAPAASVCGDGTYEHCAYGFREDSSGVFIPECHPKCEYLQKEYFGRGLELSPNAGCESYSNCEWNSDNEQCQSKILVWQNPVRMVEETTNYISKACVRRVRISWLRLNRLQEAVAMSFVQFPRD